MNYLTEVDCASSPNTYWTNDKCFYKYSNSYYYSIMSWYSFVSTCGQSNLPSYDDLKELSLSRWLNNLVKFWIGVRCGWWAWYDMGRFVEYSQDIYVR